MPFFPKSLENTFLLFETPVEYSLVEGHPGAKESEELQVKIASRAAIANMGSGLIN